jgi:hypothetical protein
MAVFLSVFDAASDFSGRVGFRTFKCRRQIRHRAPERIVHPRLPAGTRRFEGGEDIGINPQLDVLLDRRFLGSTLTSVAFDGGLSVAFGVGLNPFG